MVTNLLLIDDDEDDCFFFQEMVRSLKDISCAVASGKEAAFRMLRAQSEYPHAILLDINMPKVSGIDCLKCLKEDLFLKEIPVYMYSTYISTTDRDLAILLGARQCFVKPSSREGIRSCILSILDDLASQVAVS